MVKKKQGTKKNINNSDKKRRFFDVLKKGLKTNKLYSVKLTKLGHLLSFAKKYIVCFLFDDFSITS